MSEENVALARQGYEWSGTSTRSTAATTVGSGSGQGWREAWSTIEIRVERMEDMGDQGALALLTFEGVGRGRGAEVSMTVSHWLTFREGLVSAVRVLTPESAERRRDARS